MAEETTLLAYLVPRLTNRGEDTATDALAFILNKSSECRAALDRLLQVGSFDLEPLNRVQTQVTYQDGSRPDMDGYDKSGVKRLLVESKFWASLLQGQASGYFDQLEAEGPGMLLFIAPESRLETLWVEIKRQMGEAGKQLERVETSEQTRKARIAGSDKRLMLVSWALLLRHLADAIPGDSQISSDIRQLRGLALREDNQAFHPIHAEEFSPSLPRRIRWINRLIDDVVDAHGTREGWMTTRGLRATPQRDGYGRNFRFTDVPGDLFLCVNHLRWSTSGDTPLWLWISRNVPDDPDKLRERMPSLAEYEGHGPYDVPIYLKTGEEYQAVLDNVVWQIREIKDSVNKGS